MSLPPVHRWDQVTSPRGSIHIVHGMAEHGGRYGRLAGELNRDGFIVWAHDHRGHGKNPTPPVGLGHFADADGWRRLVDDTWAVSAEMMRSYPQLPLVLFAHSMGSFIGQALMAERGSAYRGVVLSGTNGAPGFQEHLVRSTAVAQRAFLGPRSPGEWLDRLVFDRYNKRFAPNRTRFDWLTRDATEVDKYVNDPLCGFPLTTQSWLDFLEGRRLLATVTHLQQIPKSLAVRVIAGTFDPVGEETDGVKRLLHSYMTVGMLRVSHRFYEGARHELVNETNRHQVTTDLLEWLHEVVTSDSQPA